MNEAINDGGPAFPLHPQMVEVATQSVLDSSLSEARKQEAFTRLAERSVGMSLRDYFAAKVMQGMVASPDLLKVVTSSKVLGDEYRDRMAVTAYRWADAMLKARSA